MFSDWYTAIAGKPAPTGPGGVAEVVLIHTIQNVGAGLPAKAAGQPLFPATDTPLSRASPLPQGQAVLPRLY